MRSLTTYRSRWKDKAYVDTMKEDIVNDYVVKPKRESNKTRNIGDAGKRSLRPLQP
jgi:hypothetical protein